MVSAIKAAPSKAAVKKAKSVHETIMQVLDSHEGYTEANLKLTELQNKLAQIQSEYDQCNAVAETDVAELADRILAGEELTDRQQVFARRQALAQKIEAYKQAVAKQTAIVQEQRNLARHGVQEVVAPTYKERIERLIGTLADFEAARNDVAELQSQLTILSISHSFAFPDQRGMNLAIVQSRSAIEDFVQRQNPAFLG